MQKIANQIDSNAVKLIKSGAFKGYTVEDVSKMREIKRAYLIRTLTESLKANGVNISKAAFLEVLANADQAVPGVATTLPVEKFASFCDTALVTALKERIAKRAEMDPSNPVTPVEETYNSPTDSAQVQTEDLVQQLLDMAQAETETGAVGPADSQIADLVNYDLRQDMIPEQNNDGGMTSFGNLGDMKFMDVMDKISSLVDLLQKQAEVADQTTEPGSKLSEAGAEAEAMPTEATIEAPVAQVTEVPNESPEKVDEAAKTVTANMNLDSLVKQFSEKMKLNK